MPIVAKRACAARPYVVEAWPAPAHGPQFTLCASIPAARASMASPSRNAFAAA